jgi:Protein of unknown function (DUF2786)
MTQKSREWVIDTIQKLLALRDGTSSQAEAESAAAKVQELLFKYNLDMAEVEATVPKEEKQIKREFFGTDQGKNESSWIVQLYSSVAKYNFCTIVTHTFIRGRFKKVGVAVLGKQTNIEIVHYTVDWLVPRIRKMCAESWKEYWGHEKKGKYTRGYLMGCVSGIERKLYEEWLRLTNANENSMALVAVNDEELALAKAEYYPKLKDGRSFTLRGYDGYGSGYNAGRQMEVQRGTKSTEEQRRLS